MTGQVESSNGPSQPLIGQREIETEIRLMDGETNLLAGLFREEEGNSYKGIPGLGDIPILKRLFGTQNDRNSTTDIVLLLTPHIVRVPNISSADLSSWWVGTEDTLKLRDEFQSSFQANPFNADGKRRRASWNGTGQARREASQAEPVAQPIVDSSRCSARPGCAGLSAGTTSTAAPTLDFSPQVVRQQTNRDLRLNVSVATGSPQSETRRAGNCLRRRR